MMVALNLLRRSPDKPPAAVVILSPKGAASPEALPYPLQPQVVLTKQTVTSSDVVIARRCFRRRVCSPVPTGLRERGL